MTKLNIFLLQVVACVVGLGVVGISGTVPCLHAVPSMPPTGQTTTVPSVVGTTLTQAENQLKGAQLSCTLSTHRTNTSDRTQDSKVASQTPAAGEQVAAGSTVTVVLYKYVSGPAQTTVPDLVGLNHAQTDKQATLAHVRLVVSKEREDTSDSSKNATVASQSPAAGTQVTVNSTVTVVLYKYIQGNAAIPNLVGMSRIQATRALSQVQLRILESRDKVDTGDKTKDYVVASQSPGAGTVAAAHSLVTVVFYRYLPGSAIVPNVAGMKVIDARLVLQQKGLRSTGAPSEQSTNARNKDHTVLSTNPAAGTMATAQTNITLTIYVFGHTTHGTSGGKPREDQPEPGGGKVTVPCVVGLKGAQATAVLSHVQLSGKQTSDYQPTNDPSQYGFVASQTPTAGTEVDAQTMVLFTLYIAAEKAGHQ